MNLVNNEIVELVFLEMLRVLVSVHLKNSVVSFFVCYLRMKVALALFCFEGLVCLVSVYLKN